MYITNEKEWCWTTDDTCGEPQNSIEDAIRNFYEYDCDNLDYPTVEIGHPSYIVPNMFDAEAIIWDMNDKYSEDFDIDLNDELTTDQHLELEDLLQQTLYKFLKQHNLHERVWTVYESKEYKPEDYGVDRMDYDYSQEDTYD
nr:MAG TPA: hypothetical protein [Caudoviricetes sp.]